MADKKISALTSATTPLAGTEVLPIVQSGATVKVAVSDLTAGRAISATAVTATTGNFVVGTSGQGIDFSATPGTGTSELLNDYEEGTFSPTIRGATSAGVGTYTTQVGQYTKVGRTVTCTGLLEWTAHTGTGPLQLGNLPFTVKNVAGGDTLFAAIIGDISLTALNLCTGGYLFANDTKGYFLQAPSGGGALAVIPMDTAGTVFFSATYFV